MRKITLSEALREAMQEEMKKDKNVILIGEDVAEGYRGCFGVSAGLFEEFGRKQIIDTPISENCIMGTGIGAALLGMKPIVEIMFSDFISVCFDGVFNQAAKVKFMSGDQYNLSMVIRLPGGSGGGTGPQHSQCMESIFMSIPGIKIANPSNAYDAKGLLKTAINYGDPVLFFEHKKLYNQKYNVPDEEYRIPFGEGRIVKEGKDLTIVAVSYMVNVAVEVAEELKDEKNLEIEIIDPRTILPLDTEIIVNSVKKTSKLVTLEEGILRGGIGSDIVAIINEKCFDYLDYPMKRIASKNTSIPMSVPLENEIIPNRDSVKREILDLLDY
ncbi:MAG: alpha-ketoacid dehydrogenase subunit beta [Actinobacteria bacterium]|nr:alpha-ketoacid dehydrogenase subunit beta [Actinomycetota bacterium]